VGHGARREELGYGCAGLARGAGRLGLFGQEGRREKWPARQKGRRKRRKMVG
jgi:hypothetical protein